MQVDPRTDLFSSSLVPQESSSKTRGEEKGSWTPKTDADREWARRADFQAHAIQPASEVETAFRHGSWIEDRERVVAALKAMNAPASRIERFLACGANCVVEYSPTAQRYRVRASYCHDRFCLPCATSRAKKFQDALKEWTQGETVRFGTLTLKRDDQPLQTRLTHLLRSFARLRLHNFWKENVRAGTAVVEITRGKNGDHWHVHLHLLMVGRWLDVDELREGWRKASGGSHIVDIRAVRDHEIGASYVAKYASKGWDASVLQDPECLLECCIALRGRRLLINFGEWYDRDEQLCKAEFTDWRRVARLEKIHAGSVAGERWATGILRALGFAAGEVNGEPVFCGGVVPWSGP